MKKFIFPLILLLISAFVSAQENRIERLQDLEQNNSVNQDQPVTATVTSATRLFGDKYDLTSVITLIPADSVVEVLDSDSTYYTVAFGEFEGFIYKRHAVINKTPVRTNPVSYQLQAQTQHEQEQEQIQPPQISRFSYLENKYGTSMAARLNAGKIWKGMTAEMVKDSWGTPQKINRVINANLVKEEWIYRNTWLYIENNILVEWGPIRQ
jgi:hypothetical protein